ncbi:MAG: hypothetical protein IPF46_14370 [Saprospiraceae bacterium]|nr:hypothetical protein [Candidatus Vicinibacter affinis]
MRYFLSEWLLKVPLKREQKELHPMPSKVIYFNTIKSKVTGNKGIRIHLEAQAKDCKLLQSIWIDIMKIFI